jgi:glycosyltransferase involved in cell wall biosynthesis
MRLSFPYTLNLLPMWQSHHAKASGYGRILDFLDGRVIDRVSEWTFPRRAVARAGRLVYGRSGSYWYHRESFMTELEAARLWFESSGQLFHFLYGEQCFRYFGYLKKVGERNAIVCTYHTPPDKFRQMVKNTAHMRYIDAVIVLSNMQVEFFSDIVGSDRVFYVPRSVDTEYFTPRGGNKAPAEEFTCLFVGHFLRDFETLVEAAKIIGRTGNKIRFKVITRPEYRDRFKGLNNVTFLTGISDEKLLESYQTADILVLPLLDATANNVVVEAMACGLPVVSNDIPGVRDYVSADCGILTPQGKVPALIDAIRLLYENRGLCESMARDSRIRALDFCIEETARKTVKVYEQVMPRYLAGQAGRAISQRKG